MDKVTREVAEQEVNAWLEKKKVFRSTIEANKDSFETLVDAITEGALVYDDASGCFTQKLQFPLEGEAVIAELKFKSRMNDKMLRPHLNGVKPADADGRLTAMIAALTSQPKEVIASIDSVDKKITQAIVIFFL